MLILALDSSMSTILKISAFVWVSVIMVIMGSGITISHVYCSKGEQWVLGSEMPPCKFKKACHHHKSTHTNSKDSERSKDTYEFHFQYLSQNASFGLDTPIDGLFFPITIQEKSVFRWDGLLQNDWPIIRSHPPPDMSTPQLSEIQVFRI